ncbi:OsmC family protein [Dermacoccus barathri]|uniref:OsmC family protein n=1 Tax=Dermacoccus barathri TaxID=322601 RepID=A0ABN2BUX6_9MICO
MSSKAHEYDVTIAWTGNRGTGTSTYNAYGRDHDVRTVGAPTILGSSDPAFRGDSARWNPEQLQVAALSQCHMLWYLNLAAEAGVVVTAYEDNAHGVMVQDFSGGGQFESVTLRPRVAITAESDPDVARQVHARVPEVCFIARSVNFPVNHEPVIVVDSCETPDQ